MRGMYPKRPAERRWGMHRASILPPRGVFAVRSPQIMHGARILPPSDGLDPCAGMPARAAASRDRLSTAWPLPRGACPGAPPIPATRQCLPLAVPVAARDKPPMSFGGGHLAHGLQFGQAPRGRRLRHLDGRADNGMLRRTGLNSKTVNKRAQNRRRRPQARPGLRQRCRKRPSKGRVPLGGTIGTPPLQGWQWPLHISPHDVGRFR